MKQKELGSLSSRPGWASNCIQHTLNLMVDCLKGTNEAYLEVGSFGGRSLESSCINNEEVPKYSCDIELSDALNEVVSNPEYNITFFKEDFSTLDLSKINHSISVYYYDGDHSYEKTYEGLQKIIPVLSDKALVCLDDIAYVRVYNAVRDFVRDNSTNFTIVNELWPECDIFAAMTNHCIQFWYNGWCIIEFERYPERLPNELDTDVLGSFHCGGGIVYPEKYKDIHKKC
jgi:hypothetical protein